MVFKIGLLGLGTVGAGTAQILLDPDRRHALLQELEILRVGVRSQNKPRPVEFPDGVLTTDLESIVVDPEVDIVVELIGGLEPARSHILNAIRHGKHIVTANKAVIARHGSEIFDAANDAGVYVLLEAAVGGGIPVIQPLKQALSVNRINAVTGIINGTTNYILTRMAQEGGDFAEILADAQRLGYAEADPTADVDGFDAGDKIAILASLAFGGRIKLEDVYCEGIRQVTAADIAYAEKLGFAIKLLAVAKRRTNGSDANESLQVRVHPTLVPKAHPLASINDVYNAILIEGDPIGQVMFFGPGAGAGPTASAVVSDILNIAAILKAEAGSAQDPDQFKIQNSKLKIESLHPLMACNHQHYCNISPMDDLMARFYVRLLIPDRAGVIGRLGTCFGNYNVSIESIVQIGFQGDRAEIVAITHDVREGDFHKALGEIRELEIATSIPSLLRVL